MVGFHYHKKNYILCLIRAQYERLHDQPILRFGIFLINMKSWWGPPKLMNRLNRLNRLNRCSHCYLSSHKLKVLLSVSGNVCNMCHFSHFKLKKRPKMGQIFENFQNYYSNRVTIIPWKFHQNLTIISCIFKN